MTPFGYRIVNAEAVVDAAEAEKLRDFFERFTAGGQIKASAEAAGIVKAPATCKKMLSNQIYLGTDYYPQIIDLDFFNSAQERLRKVSREKKGGKLIPDLPVYTEFVAIEPAMRTKKKGMSPQDYAVIQFESIKAVG